MKLNYFKIQEYAEVHKLSFNELCNFIQDAVIETQPICTKRHVGAWETLIPAEDLMGR